MIHTGIVAGVAPGATLAGIVIDAQGASPAYLVAVGAGLLGAVAAQALPARRGAPLALRLRRGAAGVGSPPRDDPDHGREQKAAMVHLTLVGLSEDRRRLLLVDDAGAEFTLGVDSKLRAALRGEHARLGQLEIEMDSVLRPRDIQTRIRAGESPEAVAAAAKTTVDKIMPFAAPVLAEREHIADRAQRSSVRRRSGDGGDATGRSRTLGDAVAGHLRGLNVPASAVTWDAYRREDGRWALTGDFEAGPRKGAAQFAFDAPGNYVVTENDDARWLIGDLADAPERTAPATRRKGPERRLSAVPSDELPLGDDAIEMVRDEEEAAAPERTADLTETAAKVRAVPPAEATRPSRRSSTRSSTRTRTRRSRCRRSPSRSRPPRRPRPPSARPARRAPARPCRAGTRSCSAAASRTDRSAGLDRSVRVGDPRRPAARVERRPDPGDLQGQHGVGGGDARAAVRRHRDAGHRRPPRRTPLAAPSAGRKRSSAARFSGVGTLTAPGMRPATGSRGSTSPR